MAQSVKVVRNTLTATGGGTTDFTSTGFGTVAAAIIVVCRANTTNNPADSLELSIGFWDGTNQRVVSAWAADAQATTGANRYSDDSYGAMSSTAYAFTVSAITDGIRLTMSVDNTGQQRYATVILLGGVSAACGTLTMNATQDATQESGSLGHAPKLVFFATIGNTTADTSGGNAVISFGFAADDATHRAILWSSDNGEADETALIKFSEDRCVGEVFSGAVVWSGEVTTFGADTFTMTTRDGGSSSDVCFYLSLGGDVSFDKGTLTTPTSTGNADVTTSVDPDALLEFLSTATSTTLASDGSANGLMVGMADDAGQFSHTTYVEDAAGTSNTGSVASATAAVNLDTSSGGARADMIDGTVTLGTGKFTTNYTAVDGTARKGWYVAFGPASGGGGGLAIPVARHHYVMQGAA